MFNFRKSSLVIIIEAIALVAVLSVGCAVNRATGINDKIADNLDDAIDAAIVSHNSGSYGGEGDFATASHVTLKTVENGNLVTAYIMAYYAVYSNAGGVHETAGSHIPVAITFAKPALGLEEYWEAKDGSYYLPSIHKKFPSAIWDKVDTQLYIKEQQENCRQKAVAHYASLPPATAENTLYQAYYQVALKLFAMDPGGYIIKQTTV